MKTHADGSPTDSSTLRPPAMGTRQTARKPKKAALTARETEVLQWVAKGKSAYEIGGILQITKRTVDEHVQTAVRKLGAQNRTHAVALALHDGVIEV
jgi:LuxR family transcriptional regulator, quorum-sensing system regulator BjaR1